MLYALGLANPSGRSTPRKLSAGLSERLEIVSGRSLFLIGVVSCHSEHPQDGGIHLNIV